MCRYRLHKRRSTDIVAGEVCLGLEVVDAIEYGQVGAADGSGVGLG